MAKYTEEIIIEGLIDFVKSEVVDESIEISADSTLKSAGVDSFSVIELVLFLEHKYGISLKEKDMLPENFVSIKSLAKCAMNA